MEIIWGRFVEKTGGKKSRATVPLIDNNYGCDNDFLMTRAKSIKSDKVSP